ncbi:MAG: hypothetical protein Q9169_004753 [Polycauliona sp. 2 TL-2023]
MLTPIPATYQCLLLLLVLLAFVSAVTIEITPIPDNPAIGYLIQRCHDIPPGICCKPRAEPPDPDSDGESSNSPSSSSDSAEPAGSDSDGESSSASSSSSGFAEPASPDNRGDPNNPDSGDEPGTPDRPIAVHDPGDPLETPRRPLPQREFELPTQDQPNKRITFTGLEPRDLAAVFTGYGDIPGCRGRPKATYNGGGRWRWDVPADEEEFVIEGGHWIRMPLGLPEERNRGWVEAQGTRGFIFQNEAWWGRDTSQGDRSVLLQAAAQGMGNRAGNIGHSLGWKIKRMGKRVVDWSMLMMGDDGTLEKRGIRSPDQGIVFCSAPSRSVWPDVLVMNGEEYKSEVPQGSVYVADSGKVLNYTDAAT